VNLADLLHATAARHAERPAVTDVRSGRTVTYGEVARDAERVARFLAAQGVARGQRVGLLAPDGPAYLPAAFGLLAGGACLVPVASNLTAAETAQLLAGVDVNACLAWPGSAPLAGEARRPAVAEGACAGFTFEWIDRGAAGPAELPALDPAFIRFTSGTTASAKGVVLSHEATAARVEASDRVLGFTPDDRVLWVLPLAYHFAVTIVAYVRAGAHVVMCGDTLPRAVLDGIRTWRATVLYASPLHVERLGHLAPSGPLDSVRLALSTSAPITQAAIERFEARYGVPVAQAYGIIEAGLPCINTRADGLPATSVGRPVPGYEVAVLGDDGARLGPRQAGEIGVRGAGLFSAYYSPWRRCRDLVRDGWFLTGDIGVLDESGALTLQGRKKSVIFVGGLKFFPEEVEACIDRFPGVKESRVFGEPHPRLGQVPRAEVVLTSPACDVQALRAHCARSLSPYKVPLDFTVVTAVARTPGGKILRRPAAPASPVLAAGRVSR
jgi:long-chain acyl-CoA synthetase